MSQAEQFPADVHAPPDWIRAVEGRRIGAAHWKDGSYGNDAAPSWILVDDAEITHAQAFYYAPANAERFDTRLNDEPYVALSILRDDDIVASCVLSPGTFLTALSGAAERADGAPLDALRAALHDAGPIFWDGDTAPVGVA